MSEYFNRSVPAGSMIKPWLILGPLYEDLSAEVQGLTLFERPNETRVGQTAMNEIVQQAQPILRSAPTEGDQAVFRGQSTYWNLVRRPEEYLSWGTYNISNHLGTAFLSTIITPEAAGTRRFKLSIMMTHHVLVAVNGDVVWSNTNIPFEQRTGLMEYPFEAALQDGENVVTVAIFRLARMAQVGFRLSLDAPVQAQIKPALPLEQRNQLEKSVRSIRLERDIFYPEHGVGFTLGAEPGVGHLKAELIAPGGDTLTEISDVKAGDVVLHEAVTTDKGAVKLVKGGDIPRAAYQIRCTWLNDQGQPVTGETFDVRIATPAPDLPGHENLEERKRLSLEHYTSDTGGDRPIWGAVATYALGRYDEVDESLIRKTCDFIAARKDCADFAIQGLLRLMFWEREEQRLSPEINAMMKDTVLGFKYWIDEPGDTVMYMGSENHRLLFHVAEWMAGQLFPLEEFTNSRQRGLFHVQKGQYYISEWLRQRGRFGFNEWHSNSYYPICIAPLLNIFDFSTVEPGKLLTIGSLAEAVLDMMFFNMAADSYQGIFGATHGRSYGINIKYPDYEGTAATCWQAFGVGSMVAGTSGMSPVTLATSKYKVPKIIVDIANDREAVIDSKIRQGIFTDSQQQTNFAVHRTPDYMLSALQDHRKGEHDAAIMVAQVTLGNKAVIFWNCPRTSGEGSGMRPDYWSGHTTLPRAIQHRNVLSLTWKLKNFAWMTHCFFEQSRFDEVRFDGNWAFARVGQGYVGIYSQHGLKVGDEGQYAGRELQCDATENTWLVECGREADWKSFDAFVEACTSAPVDVHDDVITYESPSVGRFVTGWDVTPTINGQLIPLTNYPLVESDWATSKFGSGELTIRYGDQTHELWYNQ